jgi:hypothetical protein
MRRIILIINLPSSCDEHISISGQYSKISRLSVAKGVSTLYPILSCPFFCTNTTGPAIHSPQPGKAQQIKKNILIGTAKAPRIAYKRMQHSRNNFSCIFCIEQILLVLHRLYCFTYYSRNSHII